MNFLQGIKFDGVYTIEVRDKDGNLKDREVVENLIVNTGLAEIAGLVGNTGSPIAFTYLAVGSASTPASATDTTLETELTDGGLERASATVARTTTTTTNDTLQLVKTFIVTGTKTVREVGVFNGDSVGTMLSRSVLTSDKNLESGDTFTLTYQLICKND